MTERAHSNSDRTNPPASSLIDDSGMIFPFLNNPSIANLAEEYRDLLADLPSYDASYTVSLFGGLLTVPELQCNCVRLELLSHLSVALCNGQSRPPKTVVASWFRAMSTGPVSYLEDPAEDVFVSISLGKKGTFRILEGIWESSAFYLERIFGLVDRLPDTGELTDLKESVYALLALSDLICERSGLSRYQMTLPP